MSDEFSVYFWLPDGTYESEMRLVSIETALKSAKAIISSVGGRIGTVTRLIITDGGDCIVFEWIYGQGITWPTAE